jgi:hypothetical protein
MELARCYYIPHKDNFITVGNSGTGKSQPQNPARPSHRTLQEVSSGEKLLIKDQ